MNNDDIKSSLQTIKIFEYLNSSELDTLLKFTQIISFAPGEILLQQGRPSKGMYVILKGNAKVSARILGKGTLQLAIIEKFGFVGEINLVEKSICTATVVALEPVECLLLSSAYFDMLFISMPAMYHKILHGIINVVSDTLQVTCDSIQALMTKMDFSPSLTQTSRIQSSNVIKELNPITIDYNTLKNVNIFKNFTQTEFDETIPFFKLIKVSKKYSFIRDKNDPFYFILYGAVQAVIVKDDKAAKLAVLGPTAFFGYLNNVLSSLEYAACENTILLQIDLNQLMALKKSNIDLWYKIYDNVYRSIINLEKYAYKLFLRLNSELITLRKEYHV